MITNYGQFKTWDSLYTFMISNGLNIIKIFTRDSTPQRLSIVAVKQQLERLKEGKGND